MLHRHFPDLQSLLSAAEQEVDSDSVARPATTAEKARGRILEAARIVFSREGYANATTRRIADQAGVQEVTVFRAFQSKADLFREAVFEPFGSFISEYAEQWIAQSASPHSVDDVTRGYLEGLYRLFRRHSAPTFALLAARAHEQPGIAQIDGQRAALRDIIGTLEKLALAEAASSGFDSFDIPVATRISFAMVLSTALFKEWLFDESSPADDDVILNELTQVWLYGTKRAERDTECTCTCSCRQCRRGPR